jgi:hypothetical protein
MESVHISQWHPLLVQAVFALQSQRAMETTLSSQPSLQQPPTVFVLPRRFAMVFLNIKHNLQQLQRIAFVVD